MIGTTLIIFGVGIVMVTWRLHGTLRNTLIQNEAHVLHSLTLLLQAEAAEEYPAEMLTEANLQVGIMLRASRLRGILAAQLFAADGTFVSAFPLSGNDGQLSAQEIELANQREDIARFRPAFDLNRAVMSATPLPPSPVLEAIIPLHQPGGDGLQGITRYYLDGRTLEDELTTIGQNLAIQGTAVFLLGGILISGSLHWVFRRLAQTNRLLGERTRELLRANQELALASKTSAIGSLATHLLHELKSHLFGIRSLLSTGHLNDSDGSKEAEESCERMSDLVRQLLDVIRQEEGATADYEVSLASIRDSLDRQLGPLARRHRVGFETDARWEGTLSSRASNLSSIILSHLLQNAIQATPSGHSVELTVTGTPEGLRFLVTDAGPGFPDKIRAQLFKPCATRKEGGTGIGLAICKQLANHLDARLELIRSDNCGCQFELILDRRHFSPDNLVPESAEPIHA
jgi:two-component system, NtrC family, sensor histidine kinase HydH